MAKTIELNKQMIIEVNEQFQLAENLIDTLAKDADVRKRFVESPISVLIENNLVKDIDKATISTSNKIFLSIISNKKLIDWIRKNEPKAKVAPAVYASIGKWARGEADRPVIHGYWTADLKQILKQEDFMHKLVSKLASDRSISSALPEGVGKAELDSWITETANEIRKGTPFSQLPRIGRKGEVSMWGVILIIVICVAILGVAIAGSGHDMTTPTSPKDRDYERIKNLLELSNQLAQIQRK